MADFGVSSTQLAMVALLMVVIAFTLANARRKTRERGPSPSEYAREAISRLKEHEGVKDDLQQLVVELHEASRRLNAQMDTKAARLEALIRDADERIAGLERQLASAEPTQPPEPSGDSQPSSRINVVLDDSTPTEETQEAVDPVRERILSLAREGRNPVQIAKETGVPPGEVELILALQQAGNASPAEG
jgi:hypothetical protein